MTYQQPWGTPEGDQLPPQRSAGKTVLLVIGIVVLLAAVGGGGYFAFTQLLSDDDSDKESSQEKDDEKDSKDAGKIITPQGEKFSFTRPDGMEQVDVRADAKDAEKAASLRLEEAGASEDVRQYDWIKVGTPDSLEGKSLTELGTTASQVAAQWSEVKPSTSEIAGVKSVDLSAVKTVSAGGEELSIQRRMVLIPLSDSAGTVIGIDCSWRQDDSVTKAGCQSVLDTLTLPEGEEPSPQPSEGSDEYTEPSADATPTPSTDAENDTGSDTP